MFPKDQGSVLYQKVIEISTVVLNGLALKNLNSLIPDEKYYFLKLNKMLTFFLVKELWLKRK